MASQAAQFYFTGSNNWQVGEDIMVSDIALRYMDLPSKDCFGEPRYKYHLCSFDTVGEYYDFVNDKNNADIDVPFQFLNGIYDRAFYLIANDKAHGWDTRKAFHIMVRANLSYWTSETNFTSGACSVLAATKEYHYNVNTVINAFATVGILIDEKLCLNPTSTRRVRRILNNFSISIITASGLL